MHGHMSNGRSERSDWARGLVRCDDIGNSVHCVPGGSSFSGEYVVFWIWNWSVCFCVPRNPLDRSWPWAPPPHYSNWTGVKLILNKLLVGNFIHVQLSLPVCSLHLFGPPPKSFVPFDRWTFLPYLWLAANGLWHCWKPPRWNDSVPSLAPHTWEHSAIGFHPKLISLALYLPYFTIYLHTITFN